MSDKKGRPPKGEFTGKSGVISVRLTPGCKKAIAASAEKSGRSLGQEVEFLLWRGLEANPATPQIVAETLRHLAKTVEGFSSAKDET